MDENNKTNTNVTINFNKRMVSTALLILNCVLAGLLPFIEFQKEPGYAATSTGVYMFVFAIAAVLVNVIMILTKTEYFAAIASIFTIALIIFEITTFNSNNINLNIGFFVAIIILAIYISVTVISDWKSLLDGLSLKTLISGGVILIALLTANNIMNSRFALNYINTCDYSIDFMAAYETYNVTGDITDLNKFEADINPCNYDSKSNDVSLNIVKMEAEAAEGDTTYIEEETTTEETTEAIVTEVSTEAIVEEEGDVGNTDGNGGYDYSDCIFPNSSFELIDFSAEPYIDMYIDFDMMQEGINEIYARHGAIFSSQENIDLFSSKDWYVPSCTMEEAAAEFNYIEKANIEYLSN